MGNEGAEMKTNENESKLRSLDELLGEVMSGEIGGGPYAPLLSLDDQLGEVDANEGNAKPDDNTGASLRSLDEQLSSAEADAQKKAEEEKRKDAERRERRYGIIGNQLIEEIEQLLYQEEALLVPGKPGTLQNPGVLFNVRKKAGGFDRVSDREYGRMLDAVNDLSMLWNKRWHASAEDVATASVVWVVMHDAGLREEAVSLCERWLRETLATSRYKG